MLTLISLSLFGLVLTLFFSLSISHTYSLKLHQFYKHKRISSPTPSLTPTTLVLYFPYLHSHTHFSTLTISHSQNAFTIFSCHLLLCTPLLEVISVGLLLRPNDPLLHYFFLSHFLFLVLFLRSHPKISHFLLVLHLSHISKAIF